MASNNGVDFPKKRVLVRVYPRYVRLRQGSEIRYNLKLSRPISKVSFAFRTFCLLLVFDLKRCYFVLTSCCLQGKAVTIHVCVIMNKCGVTANPQQIVVTASDWKLPREIVVTSETDSEIRTIQIHHKIYETYDDVYNSSTMIPSVFVSVLQKEATFLFSFGCGLHGRLGGSEEDNANVPTPFASKWLHPVQIACGKAHSAVIDVYSNIYCFGLGASGQLGQGDNNLDSSKLPLRVPTVGTSTVLHVSCGSNHTMCMTTDGKVFAWGDNAFGQLGLGFKSAKPRGIPTRVEKLVNVRGIVCGGSHSFVVTADNNVLACGSNIAGQLGLGDRKDRAIFERIPFFRNLYAPQQSSSSSSAASLLSHQRDLPGAMNAAAGDVELACGQYHSMALCGKRVYSWGNGDDGRLGHGDLESYLEPTAIASFSEIPVKVIACGGSHSGVIAANEDVYLWGNGQYGQLGTGVARNRRVPTKIRILQGKHATQLSFGEWHSMALCEGGVLYSWGFGEEGQLGLPESEQKHTRIVPYPTVVDTLSGTGATMVRCGGSHTFVVSVLEARRPQLARLHSRASRSEISRENDRIAALTRSATTRGVSAFHDSEALQPAKSESSSSKGSSRSLAEAATRAETHKTKATKAVKKKVYADKMDSAREPETAARAHVPLDFSWKERPMTTRDSVRNALRQEAKALSQMRESLTPIPMATSRAQTASAFISPRLKRLHEQVLRATEAGAGLLTCQSLVGTEAIGASIAGAVQGATTCFLQAETLGLHMSVGTSRCAAPGEDERQQQQQAEEPQSLVDMLRELRGQEGEATSSEDEDARSSGGGDDDDLVVIRNDGSLACQDLERDIKWTLRSP